ncbi:MAG: isoleucine--tRNA ligase [Bacteroidales bacterium]|jgi:isoleucyl-tRNA synthetase|nr:isoleucine--tRNA ligase [Bacteroidales bacterium]
MTQYQEYKNLDLSETAKDILQFWEKNDIFEKSLKIREGNKPFVFYEGPPSANGVPGIHHVMARAIKDIVCRYQTLKGKYVSRKAGWDTHGLPVEIGVEKSLGITKEDIGTKISVENYNKACRTEVMKYKDLWDDLTKKMGYWVDLDDPYLTFDNKYIETVWHLLSKLNEKRLIYKGYSIQPFSPAAGTGLSTHELNQPGCYRDVKDSTLTTQFKVVCNEDSKNLFKNAYGDIFFLAWTTTPWTLPSNTALAVGKNIDYVRIKTYNPYTFEKMTVILAKKLMNNFFPEKNAELKFEEYIAGQKNIPFEILGQCKGAKLEGIRYEQLLPYAQPDDGDAFRVLVGDFVTTEDGTGIVHLAPSFGADDFRVAAQNGIGALTMVDKTGRFVKEMGEFAGRFVKSAYYSDDDPLRNEPSVDIDIIVKLKKENRAFRAEKYIHSYPHCWRTDKPILYYPLDSWFVKTTAMKDRMIALNKTINWKPASTGTGRFGNWLENLVDWNLSRSRFWGIPLPIWRSEDQKEQIFIGSAELLKSEIEKAIAAGFMDENPLSNFVPGDMTKENYETFDFHRPYVDKIVLVSATGKAMHREPDLIDVWFDSGSMPYAQWHYPFENQEIIDNFFPADFIAEGVDQTRGWFFTLHAIASMVFDKVAFKNVISNGLVLDKAGNKMSKRLGNAADPFDTLEKYGADATRWYMITNAQPWDNLKFDLSGIEEVRRKFFGTLYNTYNFFALYANIDGFAYAEDDLKIEDRPEIDRWVLSELNSLIVVVDQAFADYEPTRAGRAISLFVSEHLSNWYVRLSRRRFWKGDYSNDKISAYQTLYTCLETVAQLSSPIAPFYSEQLFLDLNKVSGKHKSESIHLTDMPIAKTAEIDKKLEERMEMAQTFSSMVLSLRKKNNLRVRQPLNKLMIPVLNGGFQEQIELIKDLILSEVNVKILEFMPEDSPILVKKIKANFKSLGPKYGKMMKQIANGIKQIDKEGIKSLEKTGFYSLSLDDKNIEIGLDDVEIATQDIPGWLIATFGSYTVALDTTLTDELIFEGKARDLINKIQTLRKEKGFEVTDKIKVILQKHPDFDAVIENNFSYICSETLAESLSLSDKMQDDSVRIDMTESVTIMIDIKKV